MSRLERPPELDIMKLSPEEDAIGDADGAEDDIDDELPADLWFRSGSPRPCSP